MSAEQRVVPFNALAPGVLALRHELDAALDRVLRRGWFLQGPETEAFEQAFAAYHDSSGNQGESDERGSSVADAPPVAPVAAGVAAAGPGAGRGGRGSRHGDGGDGSESVDRGSDTGRIGSGRDGAGRSTPGLQAVGVGSGTDALRIALLALGVAAGDEVLVVANAGVPPVAAVVAAGGRPVFCDVDPASHTLDPAEIARRATPRTTAVLVVHLYGRMAAMDSILDEARARGLAVLEDCAQAHGARYRGRLAGTLGDAAAFSFYPTKNLGALGDGGAILARDPAVVERARRLRVYGWPPGTKYVSQEHGTVSRLDELQAAALRVKLPHLAAWNARRRQLAAVYREALADVAGLALPTDPSGAADPASQHVYHLFVARILAGQPVRDALRARLAAHGIGTDVHYPLPAHLQTPYRPYGQGEGSLPRTERLAQQVLSLPLYPELPDADAHYVAAELRAALQAHDGPGV